MQHKTDEQLYTRLKNGDDAAFGILYERYGQKIFAYLSALESDKELVKDLFQEIWLRLIRHARTGKNVKNFRPWFFAVASNLYRDTLRRKKLRRLFSWKSDESGHEHSERQQGYALNPESGTWRTEGFSSDFERALLQLPVRQKQIFILKHMLGFKYEEIGSMLSIATGTCKATYHKSVLKLRKALADYEGDRLK